MNNQEKNSFVRKQLLITLLEMMKTKEFDSISITRLVEEAGVGRASFYRNYKTKEDILLQEAEHLKRECELTRKDDDPNNMTLKLIRILDFYKGHSEFYMTLYQSGLKHIIQNSIIDEKSISSDIPNATAYTVSAFSYLVYGWVIEWIKRGMQESGTTLAKMFEESQKICFE